LKVNRWMKPSSVLDVVYLAAKTDQFLLHAGGNNQQVS